MCWAYAKSANFIRHNAYGQFFLSIDPSGSIDVAKSETQSEEAKKDDPPEEDVDEEITMVKIHGWILWGAWGIFGFV